MMDNFEKCLDMVLKSEGGFVNDPHDPGGMTNLGVTARVWGDYTKKPATEAVMRALTKADVAPLYREYYWAVTRCSALPDGVDYLVFDMAVNMGVGKAARLLQKALGVKEDGVIGMKTLDEVNRVEAAELIKRLSDLKEAFYRSLPTFGTFGKDWLARAETVESASLGMVG